MKFLQLILILFCPVLLAAQNMIHNPSFEDTVLRTTPLFLPAFWIDPIQESHDYFTPLHNNQYPDFGAPLNFVGSINAKDGDSYIGIRVYDFYTSYRRGVREYAQVSLTTPLKADSVYCLQFFMSLADSAVFASKNQMGIYFSSNAVSANHSTNLPFVPQIIVSPDSFNTDKENWVQYNFQYQAIGGEQYMTLGNFNDTTHLDTLFVEGGGKKFWMQMAYYYFDDFYLGHCDSLPDSSIGILENGIKSRIQIYPNPSLGLVQVESEISIEQIEIYDIQGRQVQLLIQPAKQIELPETSGVYFLRIRLENGELLSRKVVRQ